MNDGHAFIADGYRRGVRNFVISKQIDTTPFSGANFLLVQNTLIALQCLATAHRKTFPNLQSIAITGSNGKTIVKEWLYQMLHDSFNIVKSPKSYNSQIGMALSILNIEDYHELGLFEAGISRTGEMKNHASMLEPQIGIFTNIGSAHDGGFTDRAQKVNEKLLLFKNAQTLIYSDDEIVIGEEINSSKSLFKKYRWGRSEHCNLRILSSEVVRRGRNIVLEFENKRFSLRLPLIDQASCENILHCVATMLYLNIPISELQEKINRVSGLDMRLEMTAGIEGSMIINDAYSADLDSLMLAFEFTNLHAPNHKKTALLSPFEQSGKEERQVLQEIIKQAELWNFDEILYISKSDIEAHSETVIFRRFVDKDDFVNQMSAVDFRDKAILVKGARKYHFEELIAKLEDKGHTATLTINLNHLEDNLRVYKQFLKPTTGIIAIVKASAYGSGSIEIAQLLEKNGVDYLSVAFADEGVHLRKAGITTPIMVLNPDMNSIRDLVRYDLEPEVYTMTQLIGFDKYCRQTEQTLSIHLKLDTGMHRLGFRIDDLKDLATYIKSTERLSIKTIFSHLASSEDEGDDAYSRQQFQKFETNSSFLIKELDIQAKRHILNSGGISRFPEAQYNFVRLGIGMYGIDKNPAINQHLQKVHSLTANIIQIKKLKKNDSVGYNRKTRLDNETTIAIVNIGYADGVMRNLGNRNYAFTVHGQESPILGNVCMDLTIIDISHIDNVAIGDQVEIFGRMLPIENLAHKAGTIPYEILCRISQRIQRKFTRE